MRARPSSAPIMSSVMSKFLVIGDLPARMSRLCLSFSLQYPVFDQSLGDGRMVVEIDRGLDGFPSSGS